MGSSSGVPAQGIERPLSDPEQTSTGTYLLPNSLGNTRV